MVEIGETLEKFGGMLAGVFGDKVFIGLMIELLADTTPGQAYDCIIHNKCLYNEVGDTDWQKYGNIAKNANISKVTTEALVKNMRKYRRDLLGIIENTPGGMEWLDSQLVGIKSKLGI